MAEFTNAELKFADEIVSGLFNKEFRADRLDENLPIADLEADTYDFMEDLQLVSWFSSAFPSIRIGEEYIPVALASLSGNTFPSREFLRFLSYREYGLRIERDWVYYLEERINRFKLISLEQAKSTFQRLATNFVAHRIAGIREAKEKSNGSSGTHFLNVFRRSSGAGGRVPTPGCTFSVSSNTPGLRVHWSGAYIISGKYFGQPTSPTTAVLQSGTFVFGVDGGAYGNDIQWDDALVSLPGTPSVHLNY